MNSKRQTAVEFQRKYYTDSAERYESMHGHEGDADDALFKIFCVFLHLVEAGSVLDVGAATGRGVRKLLDAFPGACVCGIEPVQALIHQAIAKNNVPEQCMLCGSGERLPFPDQSFDVVCSFAMLHHVPEPNAVVGEMLRVARKAVLILDSNRFGQGRQAVRLLKLALYKVGLWRVVNYLKTGGKGYLTTEGDGLAYSYSVYDSFRLLSRWADRLILIPQDSQRLASWFHPLLTSSGILVCALKGV
ncbi:MAG TPA: class I SAM-dependent methyltransferase [Methylomirabilota bacterium]|nr:class I SAM-dependent methyltransferase [Methylomirabilota bacterium]